MPSAEPQPAPRLASPGMEDDTPFPPIPSTHILHCSYDQWFPRYRSSCIKSRIIPLTPDFVEYLREDMIVLADDDDHPRVEGSDDEEEWSSNTNTASTRNNEDSDDDDNAPAPVPPNHRFPSLHATIRDTIADLGGAVFPKLNWSAPQDAAWISPHQNTLKCTTASDIYLLLKSSSFVSHDLEHAFDNCVPASEAPPSFHHVLVLRPFFHIHPAMEFRCFVRHRALVGICQRDLNFYAFLKPLRERIVARIKAFSESTLQDTFPDGSFVFDVYVPEDDDATDSLGRVRLIDINPWAPTTDSILFDWSELLDAPTLKPKPKAKHEESESESDDDDDNDNGGDSAKERDVELRLVEKEDPAAYNFSSSKFSAHKLPKEVVDASMAGEGGLREFAQQWKEMTDGRGSDMWETQ